MILAELDRTKFSRFLRSKGVSLQIGAHTVCLSSSIPSVASNVYDLYADYLYLDEPGFSDIHVQVIEGKGLHRFYNRQAIFSNDGTVPFTPLPIEQAYAMFEWGLNWAIANQSNQYLIIHAAVIEKNGCVAIMPGAPGAGKSTLCAALIHNGWRLFSDELALIPTDNFELSPVPRPVSLKNESIDIIKSFVPNAEFGSTATDTHKGDVAHLKPPRESVRRGGELAAAKWVILPQYDPNSELRLESFSKSRMYMEVAQQTFNYHILGATGFKVLSGLLNECDCYRFSYSCLSEAIDVFDGLD